MSGITRKRKSKNEPPQRFCTPENEGIADSTVVSTPHSKGTMGAAKETLTGTTIGHIGPTEEDLATTEFVPFPAMIEALIRRDYQIREDTKIDIQALPEDEMAKKKQQVHELSASKARNVFEAFMLEALSFCNSENNAALLSVKEKIKDMLAKKPERERYEPLLNATNGILKHFCGVQISGINHLQGPDDLIYIIQDTAAINSKPLSADADATTTRRKPDLIGTSLAHLAFLCETTADASNPLSHWVDDLIANRETWREARKEKRSTWQDCWHVWELKYTRCVEAAFPSKYTKEGVLGCVVSEPEDSEPQAGPSTSKAANQTHVVVDSEPASDELPSVSCKARTVPDVLSTGKRPRPFDWSNADDTSRKRGKGGSGKGKGKSEGAKVEKTKVTVSPEVQTAYYGIEILRARWDKIHSMVLLLQDNLLSLRWYDPEGCIATERIDVVAQLPLLVVMLLVFQRFDHRMRGIACIDTRVALRTGETNFDIPHNAHAPWQLKGTHTTTAMPVRWGTGISKPVGAPTSCGRYPQRGVASETYLGSKTLPQSLKDVFFKFSFREETRDPEGGVIATARERAAHYLSGEGTSPEWVFDHLPDVIVYLEYETLSTRHIRTFLGIRPKESRIPTLMLSHKYLNFGEVKPANFRTVIWQVIRCHSLMWKMGIAHGDISFSNLLVKSLGKIQAAVINDFDQASIMTPMSRSPNAKALQRMHTKAFLARALMPNAKGSVPRLYIHDLESIMWSMTWYLQENDQWNYGEYDAIAFARRQWANDRWIEEKPPSGIRSETEGLWMPVVNLAYRWGIEQQTLKGSKPDREWLDMIVHHFGEDGEIGIEWADFHIPRENIRTSDEENAK